MTTILDFRPDLADALARGSLESKLSGSIRAELRRDTKRLVELIVSLSLVESLTQAEEHVKAADSEFSQLLFRVTESLRKAGASPKATELTNRELEHGEPLLSNADARWIGILRSESACSTWFTRQALKILDIEESQKIAQLTESTRRPLSCFVMAKCALIIALRSKDGASPQTTTALTDLADQGMTEVEDIFMAEAEYGEDDGQRVSLDEFRANLGI